MPRRRRRRWTRSPRSDRRSRCGAITTSSRAIDELAARWPTVTVVLSHACLPLERTPDQFAAWSAAMRALARRPNVAVQDLDGRRRLATRAGRSTSVRPWILACVDAFGADRCMLGSNFPIDRPFCTYAAAGRALSPVARRADARRTCGGPGGHGNACVRPRSPAGIAHDASSESS